MIWALLLLGLLTLFLFSEDSRLKAACKPLAACEKGEVSVDCVSGKKVKTACLVIKLGSWYSLTLAVIRCVVLGLRKWSWDELQGCPR